MRERMPGAQGYGLKTASLAGPFLSWGSKNWGCKNARCRPSGSQLALGSRVDTTGKRQSVSTRHSRGTGGVLTTCSLKDGSFGRERLVASEIALFLGREA